MTCITYACDIGTTLQQPPNFGWARAVNATPSSVIGSRCIDQLTSMLVSDLSAGASVALGFECPLFIPEPVESSDLSRARVGEDDRAWSSPQGGAYVTTLGLHQAAWILRQLHPSAALSHKFTVDWKLWPSKSQPLLFCWEAFVCRAAHSPTNDPVQDSATAVVEFLANEANLDAANSVKACPCISLISAAALWSGWSHDLESLHWPTLVIKPCACFTMPIGPAHA